MVAVTEAVRLGAFDRDVRSWVDNRKLLDIKIKLKVIVEKDG